MLGERPHSAELASSLLQLQASPRMKQIELFRREMTLFDRTRDINWTAPTTECISVVVNRIAQRARECRTLAREGMTQVEIRRLTLTDRREARGGDGGLKRESTFVCEPARSTSGRMQS